MHYRARISQIRSFLIEWLLSLTILVVNEYILRQAVGIKGFYTSPAEWIPYIVISLAFVLISKRSVLLTKIVILSVLQLIWFGTYSYFGNALSPDFVLLSLSQFFEIGLTTQGEFHIFVLPLTLVIVLNTILFLALRMMKRSKTRDLTRIGIYVAFLPFLAVSARAMLHASPFVMIPTAYMPSHTSTLQAAMLALRSMIANQSITDLGSPNVTFRSVQKNPEEPTHIVFIMGESIAPSQMEIYGGAEGTMPRMRERIRNPGKLYYIPKVGFAAGVATLGSVPMTLRMAHNPVVAQKHLMTLPQIARQRGFSVGLYSAQNLLPLQIAGGLNDLKSIETVEHWQDLFKDKQDGILIDQMNKSPLNGLYQFSFIHQRTNHSPYPCDIDQPVSEDRFIENGRQRKGLLPNLSNTDRERVMRYRRGLLCYDRNLDELLTHFENVTGALYVFITADHNEFLGEGGRWGHGRLELDNAIVPMILITNRPDSDIAKTFRSLDLPTSFDMTKLAARALGAELALERPDPRFYVNGVLAFGQSGYLAVEKGNDRATFRVTTIEPSASQKQNPAKTITIPELDEMLDYIDKTYPN